MVLLTLSTAWHRHFTPIIYYSARLRSVADKFDGLLWFKSFPRQVSLLASCKICCLYHFWVKVLKLTRLQAIGSPRNIDLIMPIALTKVQVSVPFRPRSNLGCTALRGPLRLLNPIPCSVFKERKSLARDRSISRILLLIIDHAEHGEIVYILRYEWLKCDIITHALRLSGSDARNIPMLLSFLLGPDLDHGQGIIVILWSFHLRFLRLDDASV